MSDKRIRVYISGPISKGDRDHNFEQAAVAHRRLMKLGYAPMNPMLTMMLPGCWQIPWEDWLAVDREWVAVSDCVLRLPGDSDGADAECETAWECGKPVFLTIEELDDHYGTRKTSQSNDS